MLTTTNNAGVFTITLNRPELHNAFDDQLIAELTNTLKQVEKDLTVRLVVLAANGKSFCAGADLNWMQRMANYSRAENKTDAAALAALMQTLNTLTKPTIAMVQGAAYGGGVGLVACCDIAIATHEASFCLSEVKIGLVPACIGPYVIAAMGERAARRYFLTAERFDADEALRLNLVHQVVAADELKSAIDKIINNLLANSPQAIKIAKQLIFNIAQQPITAEVVNRTVDCIADIRVSKEGQEGLKAFLEKRKPSWNN